MQERVLFFFLLVCICSFNVNIYPQQNNYFETLTHKHIEFEEKFRNNNLNQNVALQKEYKKFARWQWFWQNRTDANGNFSTYYKELYQPEKIKRITDTTQNNQEATWQIVGPEKYPDGTNPNGIKGIGRIDAIAVNPKNKNHVIIGARAGGIWETYNIQDSMPKWICLSNDLPIASTKDLKISGDYVFATTSNFSPILVQGDAKYGIGVIKKKLNETTWSLPNIAFECNNLAISKKNPKKIYAIGDKYIYKSVDHGENWQKLSDPVENIKTSKLLLTNIDVNPKNDNIVMITGRTYHFNSTHNKKGDISVFKTEDGGKTWQNLTTCIENIINTSITKLQATDKPIDITSGKKRVHTASYLFNNKLYLCVQQMHSPNHTYFLVSDDKKWRKFSLYNSLSKSKHLYYTTDNVDVRFQPVNDSLIIIGNRKLRVINNKKHSIAHLDYRYKFLHQDIRAIHYDTKNERLLVGTDGGINLGLDATGSLSFPSFTNASGNLNLFLAFNMSYIHTEDNRTIRIGTQDTGYYQTDFANEKWTNWKRFGPFGEGMVYTDPYNPKIVYRINAGGHGGNIQKSDNSGKTFKDPRIKAGNYVFAPLEINSKNTKHLIFDDFKRHDQYTLAISNDHLQTAIDIDNGISDLDKGMNLALALSKKDTTVFYVARKRFNLKINGIYNSIYKAENFNFKKPKAVKYINLTENFKKADSIILKKAFITDIEVNDFNENELWISFGNVESGKKIYHSIDGGLNWTNISSNLPNVPVNVIEKNNSNNTLFIGNDYGVYYYNTTTKKWIRYGKKLPIAMVVDIEFDYKTKEIIAATHGRSVWTASF